MEPECSRKETIILTVEAGETSLSTRKLVIESAGFNALSAVTAKQALSFAKRFPVSAALFDTDVTDMSLHQFIDAVHDFRPKIPVYLVTSPHWPPVSADLGDKVAGTFAKMDDPKKIIDEIVRAFANATETSTLP